MELFRLFSQDLYFSLFAKVFFFKTLSKIFWFFWGFLKTFFIQYFERLLLWPLSGKALLWIAWNVLRKNSYTWFEFDNEQTCSQFISSRISLKYSMGVYIVWVINSFVQLSFFIIVNNLFIRYQKNWEMVRNSTSQNTSESFIII